MAKNVSICFLGPDGSGKTTIIDGLVKKSLFKRTLYFHLKPIHKPVGYVSEVADNPHGEKPYSKFKSYIKLFYFICQYNFGWLKNIFLLKNDSKLIVFDRYFDDVLVDNLRYRYSGSYLVAKLFLNFIPKPDIYFILSTKASIIYQRKQEVSLAELERQIMGYNNLCDNKRYNYIEVNRLPEEIIQDIIQIIDTKYK